MVENGSNSASVNSVKLKLLLASLDVAKNYVVDENKLAGVAEKIAKELYEGLEKWV